MGRPKTINRILGDIQVEHVRRIRIRQAADPAYLLPEEDAKVLKLLAETQVALQKRRPEGDDDDEEDDDSNPMSVEELEAATAAPARAKPPAEEHDDDAG